ncbi:MAG TPA: hypothetical protein VFW00_11920, partial [Rhodocyclaceae bacterium]|nr:hypothetical protein [Rhodocyclaceae bacterium]
HLVGGLTTNDIPAAQANWYLIAMLVKADGYHFVRRQRKSAFGEPFWKWKQGNGGEEERNAYDPGTNSWVDVTNARFPELVKGQLRADMPGYAGWVRLAFFEVHNDGFVVTAS